MVLRSRLTGGGGTRRCCARFFASVGGVFAGSLLISAVSEAVLRNLIAAATLLFAMFNAWGRRLIIAPESARRHAWAAGATAGMTSTLAHVGGPPIVVYLMSTGLDARTFVGTSAVVYGAINLLKIPGYVFADVVDLDLIASTMWAWALIPVGVVFGRVMVDHINRTWFERVTLALLSAGALILLVT